MTVKTQEALLSAPQPSQYTKLTFLHTTLNRIFFTLQLLFPHTRIHPFLSNQMLVSETTPITHPSPK